MTDRGHSTDADPDALSQITRPLPPPPTGPLFRIGGEVDRVKVSLRLSAENLDPDEVTRLLDSLPDDPAVWDRIHAICGDGMDLFCGLFLESMNRGAVLSPELLRRIGERHLALSLDIYGP